MNGTPANSVKWTQNDGPATFITQPLFRVLLSPMKKLAIWSGFGLLILTIVFSAVFYHAISHDYYYRDIEQLVLLETGYTLEKSGPAKLSFTPLPGLSFSKVIVTNPAVSYPQLAKLSHVTFSLQWKQLIQGKFVVDLNLNAADIDLHIDKGDTPNWMTEELKLITNGLPFDLDKVRVKDTKISYSNHKTHEHLDFSLEKFSADLSMGDASAVLNSSGNVGSTDFTGDGELRYSDASETLEIDARYSVGVATGKPEENPKTIQGLAQGSLKFSNGQSIGALAVTAWAKNIDTLREHGIDLPGINGELGPISASATLQLSADRTNLENIKLSLDDDNFNATAKGVVENILEDPKFDVSLTIDTEIPGLISNQIPGVVQSMLKTHRATAEADISGLLNDFSVDRLSLSTNSDLDKLSLSGAVSGLPDNPQARLNVEFSSDGPISVESNSILPTGFRMTAPFTLNGKLHASSTGVRVQSIHFESGKSDLKGDVVVDLNTAPAHIKIDLNSERLDPELVELVPEKPTETDGEQARSTGEAAPSEGPLSGEEIERLFGEYTSQVTISTDWIKSLNLDFSFEVGLLKTGLYDFSDLDLKLDAHNGLFRLIKFEALRKNKLSVYKGYIDSSLAPPEFEFSGQLEHEVIEALLNLEHELLTGGELTGKFTLGSKGENLNELIANLNGQAVFSVGPFTINSSLLNTVSSDILSSVIKGVLNKQSNNNKSEYGCGAIGIRIDNGVVEAPNTISMQALDYNLAGKGMINLNTGQVDIEVVPKPRKGLGLSVSSLVGGFNVKGYIDTPDIGASGKGLLTATAMGLVLTPTVASGALVDPYTSTIVVTGLVAKGLYDRVTASNYTCENTLKRIERKFSNKADLPSILE